MKHILIIALFLSPLSVFGQTLSGVNGDCVVGGQQTLTSGLPSTGTQQIGTTNVLQGAGVEASFPSCLVTVYFTGTIAKANIFSNNNPTPTPVVNPFTANGDSSYTFFIASGCYDIVLSSGSVALPYPRTLADVCVGGSGGGGGGGSGGIAGAGTPTHIPVFSGPTTIGDSEGISTGTGPVQWPLGVSLGTNALFYNKCRNGSTGTTANLLVAYDASGCAINAQPTDTQNLKGIARTTGTGGTVDIAYSGQYNLTFDNQTAIGDWAILGSGSQGHDAGAVQPSGIDTIGKIDSVNAGAGTLAVVEMNLPDVTNTSSGGGTGIVSPCATPGSIYYAQTVSSTATCDPGLTTDGAGGLIGASFTSNGPGGGLLTLFGSSSGSCPLSVDATATTFATTCLLTLDQNGISLTNTAATPSTSELDIFVGATGRGQITFSGSASSTMFFDVDGGMVYNPSATSANKITYNNAGVFYAGSSASFNAGTITCAFAPHGSCSAAFAQPLVLQGNTSGGTVLYAQDIAGSHAIGFPAADGTVALVTQSAGSNATVQQALTAASTNGVSQVPASYAGFDSPNGTVYNSLTNPQITTQSNGARLVDFRNGGFADSLYNPGYYAAESNTQIGRQWLTTWNQPTVSGVYNYWSNLFFSTYLSGTQNFNGDGYNNKSNPTGLASVVSSWGNAQVNAHEFFSYCYGNGDCIVENSHSVAYGGINAAGDEGLTGLRSFISQGPCEYTGTIASGGTTGSVAITVTPNVACNGTQGEGRPFYDKASPITAGTITSISGSSGLDAVVGSGTGWAVSTSTTTTAAVPVTPPATTPGSVSVTVVSNAGFSIGDAVCIADPASFEYGKVSGTPAGALTITFLQPHASGATIAKGGMCGYGLALTADTYTSSTQTGDTVPIPPLVQLIPFVSTSSPTAGILWISSGGGDAYSGTAKFPSAAYTAYPMSFSLPGTNNQSNVIGLQGNSIAWSNGDAVALADYPFIKISGPLNLNATAYLPSNGNGAGGSSITYNGLWGGNQVLLHITNNTPETRYQGHSASAGNYIAPYGIRFTGGLGYGLVFDNFPDKAGIIFGCPFGTTGVTDCTINNDFAYGAIRADGNGGSDWIFHNPGGNAWEITSGNNSKGFKFDSSGNFTAGNGGLVATTSVTGATYKTATNCTLAGGSAANPSLVACAAAASGSFSCDPAASTGTCVISTTAVTASGPIFIQPTAVGSGCSTTSDTGLTSPRLAAQSAGVSFTINLGTYATKECFNYWIVSN